MLDNKDNQFEMDDPFFDQAWTNMKTMLDEEMPVSISEKPTRSKKPYALLLLLWLVGFGAGVSSILFWQQKTDNIIPEQDRPTIPIAKVESPTIVKPSGSVDKSTSNAFEKPLAETQLAKNTTATKVKPKLLKKETKLPSIANVNSFKSNTVSTKNNTSDNNSTFTSSAITTSTSSPASLNAVLVQPNNKTKTQNSSVVEVEETPLVERSSLQGLILTSEDFKGFDDIGNEKALANLLVPSAKKIKFNWGLMAGLHSELNRGYGGYSLGVIVNAEVDRKFGFATGLMFSRFQFNDILLNNTPSAFNLNQNNADDTGVYNDVTEVPFQTRSTNSTSSAIQFGSANYVSIPLLITYKTSRRIRVNMGVEYARMLSASSDKFKGAGRQDFTSTYKWYDNSSYGDLLSKTNFSALFGFSIQPNDQIGFDLRYNHGFTDLSKNSGQFSAQSDTRESLQFSMMYYFGK